MDSPSWKKPGFTLVELLVVVAIIGILASLLIPGVNKMVAKARGVRCANNLQQIAAAVFSYAADNNGYIPSAQNTKGVENILGNWFDDLTPYLGVDIKGDTASDLVEMRGIIVPRISCPTFRAKYQNKPDFSSIWAGYGMNLRLKNSVNDSTSTQATRQKLAALPNPSRTILVGEGSGLNLDIHPSYQFTPDVAKLEGWKLGGTPDRHNGTSNYLFVDGHIETLDADGAVAALKPRVNQ